MIMWLKMPSQKPKKLNLKELLEKLKTMEYDSIAEVTEYIEELHDEVPTLRYILNLQRIEPLLQTVGKREHFIHMFNVYLLGEILWKNLFSVPIIESLWKEIAFSHDLAYPIEAIQDEIEEFFRVYFHRGKTPKFLVPKTLFYSYGNFTQYHPKLIDKASKYIKTSEELENFSSREILEDLVLYNLYANSDHAVISALFTLHANEEKDEEYKYNRAIPILLHNIYWWKYSQLKELNQVLSDNKKEALTIHHTFIGEKREYEYEIDKKYPFLNFIFERRFQDKLKKASKKEDENTINAEFLKLVSNYQDKLLHFHISISKSSDEIIKYIFMLSLADFLQEWGRFTFIEKGLASIGLRLNKIEKNKITITVPFLESKENLYPTPECWDIENGDRWCIKSSRRDVEEIDSFRQKNKIHIGFYEETIKKEIKSNLDKISIKMKRSENHASEAAIIVWFQSIKKLWEYVYNFSWIEVPDLSEESKRRGFYEYNGKFLTLQWNNIKNPYDPDEDFIWPPQ